MMEPDKITQSLFMRVFQLANLVQAQGDSLSDEVTFKQWFLLLILCKDPSGLSVNALAEKLGITRQSTKKMITILERNGYLTVAKSEYDSRSLSIFPTDKAYIFFKNNKQRGYELMDKAIADIAGPDVETLYEALGKMLDNLRR